MTANEIPCYTAGGAVRDRLLGRAARDVDVVFDASEQDFIQRNPEARKVCGKACAIFLLRGAEYTPLRGSGASEIPLPQALRENLERRDFTLNALLLSATGVLRAHPLSFADLKNRLLRPASPDALAKDPARAFRAARLLAALPSFTAHEECLAQMRVLGPALAGIAAEQVGGESLKACLAEKPGNFLRLLCAANCLDPWFTELSGADAKPAGPPRYHDSSILEHICRVMDATAHAARAAGHTAPGSPLRALAVWMALCHDLGKNLTAADQFPRHRGHEHTGEAPALALGTRLRLPRLYIKAGGLAARLHMKAGLYHQLRPGTQVDLLIALRAAGILEPFFLMVSVDSHSPELAAQALADCERLLRVSLPQAWRNRGEESGRRLRELRSNALRRR